MERAEALGVQEFVQLTRGEGEFVILHLEFGLATRVRLESLLITENFTVGAVFIPMFRTGTLRWRANIRFSSIGAGRLARVFRFK